MTKYIKEILITVFIITMFGLSTCGCSSYGWESVEPSHHHHDVHYIHYDHHYYDHHHYKKKRRSRRHDSAPASKPLRNVPRSRPSPPPNTVSRPISKGIPSNRAQNKREEE